MSDRLVIHWFRQDLRLADNPALTLAAHQGRVLPIYIWDEVHPQQDTPGAASRWWLHNSLQALQHSLAGQLSLYRGDPLVIIESLLARFNISAVYWNRCYEPWAIARDQELKTRLKAKGITAESCNGSLLWEPWSIKKGDGSPYKMFTPFYRKGCLQAPPPREPLPAPQGVDYQHDSSASLPLEQLNLIPAIPWYKQLEPHWQIGEQGAQQRLQQFIQQGLDEYKTGRDFPARPCVSKLSSHLHFGEISPNQLWYRLRAMADTPNIDHFCSELGWREFSYSQLFYHPTLPTQNLHDKFDRFAWRDDAAQLKAWQSGQTGIPLVDAGMRELWQTGQMHNRVRMVVASFLVKNLRLHWRLGARWFWDTLLDADLANNSASWQWVAGSGADAAPYFRIFNPVTQGQKFDPQGEYIRQYVPELAALPDRYLFSPWLAPQAVLEQAGVVLGESYPQPLVDLKLSREAALAAFKSL